MILHGLHFRLFRRAEGYIINSDFPFGQCRDSNELGRATVLPLAATLVFLPRAFRACVSPNNADDNLGFRCVMGF
jgi:hypothetical protein